MTSRIAQGYAMAATAYLFIGLSGTLVTWATAPASLLLTLRFAVAALLLGAVFARKRRVAGLFVPGVWPRLLAVPSSKETPRRVRRAQARGACAMQL